MTPNSSERDVLQELLNRVVRKEWTADDLIEAFIDESPSETTVSAGVGSGTDRAIGTVRPVGFKDEQLEQLFKEFEEYLKKTNKPSTVSEATAFVERRALPDVWIGRFVSYVRARRNR